MSSSFGASRRPENTSHASTSAIAMTPARSSRSGVNDLVTAASTHKPGDRVAVTIVRHGKQLTRSVTLAKEPSTVATAG